MVAGALSASPKSAKAAELGAQLVSSHWYRVAGIKPRLRDHLKAHAHRYRGQLWHVVEDRISAKFHRFDTQAWRVNLREYFPVARFGASFYTKSNERFAIEDLTPSPHGNGIDQL